MRTINQMLVCLTVLGLISCDYAGPAINEVEGGYEILESGDLTIQLADPLSSNVNNRGDAFSSRLTEDFIINKKKILPKNTEIRGLVTEVEKWNKFGDHARLFLSFDQIAFNDGNVIPVSASLDTRVGAKAIRVKGKEIQDAKIVGSRAIVGALAGNAFLDEDGAKKGVLIGVAVGAGAVLLSDAKEVSLPVGTELTIRLNAPLFIPKQKTP